MTLTFEKPKQQDDTLPTPSFDNVINKTINSISVDLQNIL
jgi:hypothetical protein